MVKSYQDALRRLWDGLCDVYVLETAVNKANGRDEPTEVQKLHGEPCRLSFSSISSTTEQDSAPLIQQSVKLFISKTAEIPAGSKIVVTQEGRTTSYAVGNLLHYRGGECWSEKGLHAYRPGARSQGPVYAGLRRECLPRKGGRPLHGVPESE